LKATKNGRIAILGTKGTIQSQAYQKIFLKQSPQTKIFPVPCPLFVPLVEESYTNHPATQMIAHEYLKPLKTNDVDTVLLGCTHYPLLEEIIQNALGPDVLIINSAIACAEKISKLLKEGNLQNTSKIPTSPQYFVSDDPQKFQQLGQSLLNLSIPHVHLSELVKK
jgi:glutamate racemase